MQNGNAQINILKGEGGKSIIQGCSSSMEFSMSGCFLPSNHNVFWRRMGKRNEIMGAHYSFWKLSVTPKAPLSGLN